MPNPAHITSIGAIEAFRAGLVTYLETARPTLDEISGDVMRTRLWLEQDRLAHWKRELQRRHQALHEAEDALRSARMSQFREATDAEVAAVRKAKAALEAAQDRLRQVQRWCRDFDSRITPLAHQLESLRTVLAMDMPQAVCSLTRTLEILADYAGTNLSAGLLPPDAPSPSAGPDRSSPDSGGVP
jgi:DNA repair exonuclease SbcCD ATPase subunit